MSSRSSSTVRVPFDERLRKLATTAWDEIKVEVLNTQVPADRPLTHFILSATCKLVIDWVFAEVTRNGEIGKQSLSKSYGYIVQRPSLVTKTPTIFIPLHIMPGVSVHIDDEAILEGSYYKVLKQDVIDVSGNGRVFGLAMFEGTA